MYDKKLKRKDIAVVVVVITVVIAMVYMYFNNQPYRAAPPEKIAETFDESKFVDIDGFKYYDNDKYESIIGIDVSEHQGKIDWKKVSESGVKFAIIRVGYRGTVEGEIHLDKYFEYNMQEASKYGIDIGVYFFSAAINKEEIKEEANFVLDAVGSYRLDYPIVYDMEPHHENDRINVLSSKDKTDLALEFCKLVVEDDYLSMIYGNIGWLHEHLEFDRIKDHEIWYAAYQPQPTLGHSFRMWQYSDAGQLPGISTNVDMNIYIKKK